MIMMSSQSLTNFTTKAMKNKAWKSKTAFIKKIKRTYRKILGLTKDIYIVLVVFEHLHHRFGKFVKTKDNTMDNRITAEDQTTKPSSIQGFSNNKTKTASEKSLTQTSMRDKRNGEEELVDLKCNFDCCESLLQWFVWC